MALGTSVPGVELEDRLSLPGAEGLDVDLVLAGLGSRTVAALIDLALQAAVLFVLAVMARLIGLWGVPILYVGGFMALLGYPVISETFVGGHTVGKAAMGIVVVSSEGSPVTFMSSVIRNVIRVIDLLPGTYFVGAVAILFTARNQRVGDLVAGTIVVQKRFDEAAARHTTFAYPPGMTVAPVLSPHVVGWDLSQVSAEEVAAVRSFLARRAVLDPTHRAQLAQTLSFQLLPKVAGVPLDGGPEMFLERIVAARPS